MSHGSVAAEAAVAVPLAVAGVLYARGALAAWKRAGPGRGVTRATAFSFGAGLAALGIALLGPVDRWGAELFSAHMAQHTLLMNLAAPLLVLGAPLPTMLRALPVAVRTSVVRAVHSPAWRAAWELLSRPAVATVLQLAMMFLWHLPGAIAESLRNDWLHALMHSSLLGAALLFWSVALDSRARSRWRGIACLAITAKVMGLACIVLLLGDHVAYTAAYGTDERAFGLDAADDERLGWGLMMLTGGPAYFVAAAWLFSNLVSETKTGDGHLFRPRF